MTIPKSLRDPADSSLGVSTRRKADLFRTSSTLSQQKCTETKTTVLICISLLCSIKNQISHHCLSLRVQFTEKSSFRTGKLLGQ